MQHGRTRNCPCRKPLKQSRIESGAETWPMKIWYYFWTLNFIVAGSAFCIIAIIVSIRGLKDLRKMFASLHQHAIKGSPPPE